MKAEKIVAAYTLLKSAKAGCISDSKDQIAIIRDMVVMKAVYDEYKSVEATASESFKGDDHDRLISMAQKWDEEEKAGKPVSLTDQERIEVNIYLRDYYANIGKCIQDALSADKDMTLVPISMQSLSELMKQNEWTMEQVVLLQEILCHDEAGDI